MKKLLNCHSYDAIPDSKKSSLAKAHAQVSENFSRLESKVNDRKNEIERKKQAIESRLLKEEQGRKQAAQKDEDEKRKAEERYKDWQMKREQEAALFKQPRTFVPPLSKTKEKEKEKEKAKTNTNTQIMPVAAVKSAPDIAAIKAMCEKFDGLRKELHGQPKKFKWPDQNNIVPASKDHKHTTNVQVGSCAEPSISASTSAPAVVVSDSKVDNTPKPIRIQHNTYKTVGYAVSGIVLNVLGVFMMGVGLLTIPFFGVGALGIMCGKAMTIAGSALIGNSMMRAYGSRQNYNPKPKLVSHKKSMLMMIGGAALALAGAVCCATGVGLTVGVPMLAAGVALFTAGNKEYSRESKIFAMRLRQYNDLNGFTRLDDANGIPDQIYNSKFNDDYNIGYILHTSGKVSVYFSSRDQTFTYQVKDIAEATAWIDERRKLKESCDITINASSRMVYKFKQGQGHVEESVQGSWTCHIPIPSGSKRDSCRSLQDGFEKLKQAHDRPPSPITVPLASGMANLFSNPSAPRAVPVGARAASSSSVQSGVTPLQVHSLHSSPPRRSTTTVGQTSQPTSGCKII